MTSIEEAVNGSGEVLRPGGEGQSFQRVHKEESAAVTVMPGSRSLLCLVEVSLVTSAKGSVQDIALATTKGGPLLISWFSSERISPSFCCTLSTPQRRTCCDSV